MFFSFHVGELHSRKKIPRSKPQHWSIWEGTVLDIYRISLVIYACDVDIDIRWSSPNKTNLQWRHTTQWSRATILTGRS